MRSLSIGLYLAVSLAACTDDDGSALSEVEADVGVDQSTDLSADIATTDVDADAGRVCETPEHTGGYCGWCSFDLVGGQWIGRRCESTRQCCVSEDDDRIGDCRQPQFEGCDLVTVCEHSANGRTTPCLPSEFCNCLNGL